MTSLKPNLVQRIVRLPKPAGVADALQPLFEAISNAIHSTQGRFGDTVGRDGRIVVTVSTDRKKQNVSASVEDNGVGLDKQNWEAFLTTDTDNKITIGGKGVGRLMWLDCFRTIRITSVFREGRGLKKRKFEFALHLKNQIRRLRFTMMECDKIASADLKGSHFIHFIAHDRTVHSQCIDGKLGLRYFGLADDRVFHAVLSGIFLDRNVNQERTKFLFEDVILERIVNDVCWPRVEEFLSEPLAKQKGEQRAKIETITATYPSVAFGEMEELQQKVPSGELKEDAIYSHLARERFRRDERQAEKIRSVLTRLKRGTVDAVSFASTIKEAGQAIEAAEQRSLAEYVVRRKVVLDFIEILLQKVRESAQDSAYQREDILHSFICPVRVSTVQGATRKVEPAASHDLWILDERLAFAQYFSSDVEFSVLSDAVESSDRPDILIFDYVHGLRQTEETSKILLVEFKRPGRISYADDEHPQFQVERYVRRLQSGDLRDVRGRPIKLDQNTIFYCFIVADIIGKLDDWTFSWQRTADGRGRIYRPNSGFRGSIELVGWDDLLRDARARNQAFFDKAGISGKSFFSAD